MTEPKDQSKNPLEKFLKKYDRSEKAATDAKDLFDEITRGIKGK